MIITEGMLGYNNNVSMKLDQEVEPEQNLVSVIRQFASFDSQTAICEHTECTKCVLCFSSYNVLKFLRAHRAFRWREPHVTYAHDVRADRFSAHQPPNRFIVYSKHRAFAYYCPLQQKTINHESSKEALPYEG